MRGRAWRRSQNERIIKKRLKIAKECWYSGNSCDGQHNRVYFQEWLKKYPPGHLKKYNFTCSCFMCKIEKHTSYAKRRRKDKEYERVYSQVFRSDSF